MCISSKANLHLYVSNMPWRHVRNADTIWRWDVSFISKPLYYLYPLQRGLDRPEMWNVIRYPTYNTSDQCSTITRKLRFYYKIPSKTLQMVQVLKDMIAKHGTLPRPIFHGKHINIKIQLCLLKISILCILLWLLTCIQKLEVPSCTIYFYYFYCNNRNILHILVKDVHLQSPIYLIIKTTRANK